MADRAQLFEALLDSFPEGAAVLDEECRVRFWNRAAQAITGAVAMDLVGRPAPDALQPLLTGCREQAEAEPSEVAGRCFPAHARHAMGHDISCMARRLVLRDEMGARIGTAVLFHPAECLDALPRGAGGGDENVEASQKDLEERLGSLFEDFMHGGAVFGVLWIAVDQARDLRKTHGQGACEAMLTKVMHALTQGLRPAEHLGRWGEDEFLVISHERTPAMLAMHGQVLAGLARTADFRWWGDRVSLTVSIGAAQAESGATLVELLERAKAAMFTSFHAGGNSITRAPEGHSCSPS